MFSANENLVLRQAKKRVVGFVEECIPSDTLDLGVNVMAMQVSCKAPGCVPLETAIIIVFPSSSDQELLPGLPESRGGSYKTKILLPLNEVTKQDVLEALPPSFMGGLRTMEKLCLQARDVMFAQITNLFGGGSSGGGTSFTGASNITIGNSEAGDVEGRRLMALYLQESLQQYLDRGCVAPEWGEPYAELMQAPAPPKIMKETSPTSTTIEGTSTSTPSTTTAATSSSSTTTTKTEHPAAIYGKGNIVIRRPKDYDDINESGQKGTIATSAQQSTTSANVPSSTLSSSSSTSSSSSSTLVNSMTQRRLQQAATERLSNLSSSSSSSSYLLSRLAEREHAPGIRQPGCPCCDADNPSNVIDQMMLL